MTGIGIIGAGPGSAALHLPTAGRLADRLEIVHVSDGGSGRSADVAASVGARHSTGTAELLADPRVEAVVIASPPHLHAEQALAAVAAGVRGVLCEKPLALSHDDADAVVDAVAAARVALVVGTNHLFDPAWGQAKHHVAAGGRVRAISITVALPPNARYHDVVTEPVPAQPVRPAPDMRDAGVRAGIVRQLVLGLLIHDLPLVRDLAPGDPEVLSARFVPPIGCAVAFRVHDVLVQATAVLLPEGAEALWRMTVATTTDEFEIEFPPSFVHGGSASVRAVREDGVETVYVAESEDGYVQEWRTWADALDGGDTDLDGIRADAHFAIVLADGAAARILAEVAA
ncbi:Gfo/Idh/MocA family protein [Microbacterium sp. MC2]